MSGHKPWREIRAKSKADPRRVAELRREIEEQLQGRGPTQAEAAGEPRC